MIGDENYPFIIKVFHNSETRGKSEYAKGAKR